MKIYSETGYRTYLNGSVRLNMWPLSSHSYAYREDEAQTMLDSCLEAMFAARLGGSEKVMLYGFSGSFLCRHLQVVKQVVKFDPRMHFAENDKERIIMTVQDKPEMFSAKIGDSCLKAAADYLEKKSDTLVTE